MADELKRLRTVTPTDNDGGCGHDVQWAVGEIEHLRATLDRVSHFATGTCDMPESDRLKCIAAECKAERGKIVISED